MPLSSDDPPKKKKKKSKKRKRSEGSSSNQHEESNAASQDEEIMMPDEKLKRRTKKLKKVVEGEPERKDQQSLSTSEAISERKGNNFEDTPPRKKRKKKKDKKKRPKSHPPSEGNENDVEGRPASPTLEGAMVDGVMVLVDRNTGNVYSATERDHSGNRVVVGAIDGKGNIVLTTKGEDSAKQKQQSQDAWASKTTENEASDPAFPFETDPDDHCESPLEAYGDIVALLHSHARRLYPKQATPNEKLTIYDPYFCNGRVANHLKSLGFSNVYNRKEDCYQVWTDSERYPRFDVFLTNPPYSGDHIEKLMRHVTSKQVANKPWMLLMPNFVHKKDYFQRLTTANNQQPIYLVPHKRYIYQPPANFRDKKASDTHKKSSPFVSMWYLWGGSRQVTDEWYRILQQESKKRGGFDVARSKSALRDLRRKPKGKKK